MPIVLTTGAPTASGRTYRDIVGKQYEFPIRYRHLVVTGTPFVYYRGRRGTRLGEPQYFGDGVVSFIEEPDATSDTMIAHLADVRLFDTPIAAKNRDGTYIETGTSKGTNWANGVRKIDSGTYRYLIARTSNSQPDAIRSKATPDHASRLERYSVNVALQMLATEFGRDSVEEMPPGNPGYDIAVKSGPSVLHVEVKGTVLPSPVFHLSEGQRRHSELLGDRFMLVVIYDVDLHRSTHKVVTLRGSLDRQDLDLQPDSWIGRLMV
ncbi:protein NO VEIN domain-containing protein [Cellulomonas sp. Y8]|uniref:protein NO VEIN domain-containing protein n=1 Tax=Cellulomonas sp. Y8 TaxID=2591145 RepID=UPI0011C94F4C|nr:DUF3883 domain-containing protein [Cellulomonas sp. Y8]